jgi:hypothetical protein
MPYERYPRQISGCEQRLVLGWSLAGHRTEDAKELRVTTEARFERAA